MDEFLSFRLMSCQEKQNEKITFPLNCIVRLPVWTFLVSKVDPLIANFSKQKPPS